MFILDNRRYDQRIYQCKSAVCEHCKMLYTDEKFMKEVRMPEPFLAPYYFHALDSKDAIIFCGPEHSNIWARENKDKIWDKSNG